jgi:hypothetical protein
LPALGDGETLAEIEELTEELGLLDADGERDCEALGDRLADGERD